MGGAAALAALPATIAARPRGDAVARVRAAMGGEVLRRVEAIEWSGTAMVVAGPRVLRLGVETRIEPFTRARSNSWILAEGRASTRTLMIERDTGFAVIGGSQRALPPAQAAHERQQYGLYGLMLFGDASADHRGVRVAHPGFPPALFQLDRNGMPASADYVVAPPEPGPPIREHVTFSGVISDQGMRWPRRIAISQNGKPFFLLAITELRVTLGGGA